MTSLVQRHYGSAGALSERIAARLSAAGKDITQLTPADLAPIDEFHIRGRRATLELAAKMEIAPGARVLDLGSGLGGPARTLAAVHACSVTGIDLTAEFCAAATEMSRWVRLTDNVDFEQGDATALRFAACTFDAVMTIHAAMNIARKDRMYAEAHRVLKPGRIFAIYDVLRGDGGDVLFPVPWAPDASISHLATRAEMRELLEAADFVIVEEIDSTDESAAWFRDNATRLATANPPPITLRSFLGEEGAHMTINQVRNLAERRIQTVTYICRRR